MIRLRLKPEQLTEKEFNKIHCGLHAVSTKTERDWPDSQGLLQIRLPNMRPALSPDRSAVRKRQRRISGAAPAAFRPYRRPALIERRIAAVLAAVPRVDRAPASAGPRRLAPLHARPALGVSVGEQQSRYCDAEQSKTDRAHGSSPSPAFQLAAHRLDQCGGPSNFETELRSLTHACCERTNICRRGTSSFRWRSDPSRTL